MNRLLVLSFVLLTACTAITAQQNEKLFLGIAGWGSANYQQDKSFYRNISTDVTCELYAGQFITPKTAIYALLKVNYSAFWGKDTDTSRNHTTKQYNYYMEPQIGIGVRNYYAFTEKNILGLLIDAQAGGGFNIYQIKTKLILPKETKEDKTTRSTNYLSVTISPGVYINISKKWQALLKVRGFYLQSYWGNDDDRTIGNSTLPVKGSNIGLDFSEQSFTLSFMRFL